MQVMVWSGARMNKVLRNEAVDMLCSDSRVRKSSDDV
jgi:hypothetical protein